VAKNQAGSGFVYGAFAAFCNITVTFPMNKLISRQMYEGLTAREALRSMRADQAKYGALLGIFRGVAPPLMQRTVASGVMYGTYDFFFAQLQLLALGVEGDGRLATDVPNAGVWHLKIGAAMLSGCVEALLTPFERVQTILQHRAYTEVFSNTWDVTRAMRRHGVREFYRGFTAVCARNAPANALFFTLRDPARDLLPATPPALWWGAPGGASWLFVRDFVSGAGLGALISTAVYPITTLKNVMQLDLGSYHKSMGEALEQVRRDRAGLSGLYKGAGANAARALISWGITNSAYEVAKRLDWTNRGEGR
jgi:hypothetical protein